MRLKLIFALVLLVSLFSLTTTFAQDITSNAWYSNFTPVRERYIAEGAAGTGTFDNPMSLQSALDTAQPGDLYWIFQGTYSGDIDFRRDGTATAPIVFRAYPGHHVRFQGSITVYADYNWLWGLDISDPNGLVNLTSVGLYAPGIRLINNYIHDKPYHNGVGAWDYGAGQVLYGNIIRHNGYASTGHPHNIYIQNDFAKYGYKYVVNNIVMEEACDGCPIFQGYAEGDAVVTGLHVERNIFAQGTVLFGGFGIPSDRHIVRQNHFYDAKVQFGYRRPSQAEFTSNQLYRSRLFAEWFWGAGEVLYSQTAPNVFTGNTILAPSDTHVRLRTSAYFADNRYEGIPALQPTDTFNNNTYSSPFNASFYANGQEISGATFDQWKAATLAAGNAFDTNSQVIAMPTAPQVTIIPNEYEPGRANISIFNFSKAAQVAVDLASVVAQGSSFTIYNAQNMFGTPVATGKYAGPVNINMAGQEFGAFVVISQRPVGTDPAADGLTVNGNMTTYPILPTFNWSHETAGDWYNLVIYNGSIVLNEWFPKSVCSGTTCSVTLTEANLPVGLFSGPYSWWVRSWKNYVFSDWSQEGRFTINVAAPNKLENVAVSLNNQQPTITWKDDANAAWFQVYVGSSNGTMVYWNWHQRTSALCNGGTCTLVVPAQVTIDGSHVVYMQAWGPGGFNANNINVWTGPINFTVDLPNADVPNVGVTISGQVVLSWDSVPGAAGYQVWLGSSPDLQNYHFSWYSASEANCAASGECTLALNLPLDTGKMYIWFVKAAESTEASLRDITGWLSGEPFAW